MTKHYFVTIRCTANNHKLTIPDKPLRSRKKAEELCMKWNAIPFTEAVVIVK